MTTVNAATKPATRENPTATVNTPTKPAQIRLALRSPANWRVTMIDAYRAGVPGNGKPFPDGSKIAKIEWKPKKSTESPFSVRVPDTLQDIFLIEKDIKRFPRTKGWAYAVFDYDPASDTFKPNATGVVNCGFACHTRVAAKDYIFTAYGK